MSRTIGHGGHGARQSAACLACCVAWWLGSATSWAGLPRVEFDVSPTIECQDVTLQVAAGGDEDDTIAEQDSAVDKTRSDSVTDERVHAEKAAAEKTIREKIIEARFRVSVLAREGNLSDVEQLMITLVSPSRRLRVVSFSPETQLVSDVVGEVETVRSKEQEKSITASLGGAISGDYGPLRVQVAPAAGAGNIQRHASKETYKRIPPKHAVLVSGTTNYGHGVFFKLKPSPQRSLEGTKEFTCRFAVPPSWRGDWAVISCKAHAQHRSFFSKELKLCGIKQLTVGLYLAGDAEAKERACTLPAAGPLAARVRGRDRGDGLHVALKPILGPASCGAAGTRCFLPAGFPIKWPATRGTTTARSGARPLPGDPQAKVDSPLATYRETLRALRDLSGFVPEAEAGGTL